MYIVNSYVGKKDAKFHNVRIDYSPNPPVLGQLLTASVSATISKLMHCMHLYAIMIMMYMFVYNS